MAPHWYSGESPFWRFIVTNLKGETLTLLDKIASERSVLLNLNSPSEASGYVPSDVFQVWGLDDDGYPFLNEGNRLLYGFRREFVPSGETPSWICRFAGRIELVEDASRTNDARTHYTAYDPWRWWHNIYFIAGEDSSNFYKGDMKFVRYAASEVIRILLGATNFVSNANYNVRPSPHVINSAGYTGQNLHVAYWSETANGPVASIDDAEFTGQKVLPSITIPRSTSLGDAISMVVSTGTCDIVLTPMWDPVNWPGTTHILNVVDKAGQDRFDAVFNWDVAGRSVVQISDLFDGTSRANEIAYLWENGGKYLSTLIAEISDQDSIDAYDNYSDIHSINGLGGPWAPWAARSLGETELLLRAIGKQTVTVTPAPERSPRAFNEWYLGDIVRVYASSNLRSPISGPQRIYGMPVDISDNGLEKITQMIVASDEYSAPAVDSFGGGGINSQTAVFTNRRRPSKVRPSTKLKTFPRGN